MTPELETLFTQKNLRLTTPRKEVFQTLKDSKAPLTIGAIIKKCPQIDRVSVYRTIELFTQLHIVGVIPMGWKQRYELTDPFKAHHHHLYCVNCAKLTDIHSRRLEQLIADITATHDFVPREHKFEVSGLCQKCADGDKTTKPF